RGHRTKRLCGPPWVLGGSTTLPPGARISHADERVPHRGGNHHIAKGPEVRHSTQIKKRGHPRLPNSKGIRRTHTPSKQPVGPARRLPSSRPGRQVDGIGRARTGEV